MVALSGFNGCPVRVVVIKDDCCNQEVDNRFIDLAFETIPNIDLSVVGCSELSKNIRAIRKDAEMVIVPFLRGCEKDGSELIKQLRKERNGIPIFAWDETVSVDDQVDLFNAGADYVSEKRALFSKENLSYIVNSVERKN